MPNLKSSFIDTDQLTWHELAQLAGRSQSWYQRTSSALRAKMAVAENLCDLLPEIGMEGEMWALSSELYAAFCERNAR